MIIRGMNLSLIIACIIIILALIIFPLIVSHKAERRENLKSLKQDKLSEWEKIKEYGNKINKKTRDK
jgi:flagellar biosynthesis/type III secretory pathway M-ring protein FliF/YscJ